MRAPPRLVVLAVAAAAVLLLAGMRAAISLHFQRSQLTHCASRCSALRQAAPPMLGAGDPRIYDSPLVTPAPPAPAPQSSGNASFHFSDARGVYHALRGFGDGGAAAPYVNVLFTRAGHLRSGDLHACEQLNHVVFGRVALTRLGRDGRDVVTRHVGGDVVRIPPHVPHLYAFETDALLTEAWRHPDGTPCPFQAWLYTPYRDRIPAASAEKRFADGGAEAAAVT